MFSIIIPCHNKGPHITRCIQSVIGQSFKQWEIIFVDDASTDNSLIQVNQFEDSRIFVFRRDNPGPGGYAARNLGIAKAKFPWVCFLDADDEWKVDYLEKLMDCIQYNSEIELIGSAWEVVKGDERKDCPITSVFPQDQFKKINFEEFLKLSIGNRPPFWTSAIAVKKESILLAGGFPEGTCKSGGDVDTWLRLMWKVNEAGFWNRISSVYHIDSVNMVTRTIRTFETPCLVGTVKTILGESTKKHTTVLLKKYANKYLLAQFAKSIRAGVYNAQLPDFFYFEVDLKKYAILKMFIFKPLRQLYRLYLEKKDPFYG
jgi:glycosyltransferase involved in cell wall biosynthesis